MVAETVLSVVDVAVVRGVSGGIRVTRVTQRRYNSSRLHVNLFAQR